MNEKMSRVLLAIEALVLCLPLTLLYAFRVLPATIYLAGSDATEPLHIIIVVNLVIIAGLLSAWRLMLAFILFGHASLMRVSRSWWTVSGLVACLALLAWFFAASVGPSVPAVFSGLGWGIIFLPPYLHLLLERCRGRRTRRCRRLFFHEK